MVSLVSMMTKSISNDLYNGYQFKKMQDIRNDITYRVMKTQETINKNAIELGNKIYRESWQRTMDTYEVINGFNARYASRGMMDLGKKVDITV
jgi:hypothetical protein